MTEIADDVVVDCASGEAASYLAGFFEQLGAPGGGGAVLTLCIALGDAAISREVVAKITAPKGSPGYRVMGVTWSPKDGGPYPDFEGTLALSDLTSSSSKLVLSGKYGPPGGLVGAAFDAVVGRRMASASLKALLGTLKAAIEAARTEATSVAASYLPTYE
jgi:hypothetical protein